MKRLSIALHRRHFVGESGEEERPVTHRVQRNSTKKVRWLLVSACVVAGCGAGPQVKATAAPILEEIMVDLGEEVLDD